jgi:hypothetical protein
MCNGTCLASRCLQSMTAKIRSPLVTAQLGDELHMLDVTRLL